MTVPKIAGNTPPSVFDSRGSSDTNSQTRARYRAAFPGRPIAFGVSTCRTWMRGRYFSLPSSTVMPTLAVRRARRAASRASCS